MDSVRLTASLEPKLFYRSEEALDRLSNQLPILWANPERKAADHLSDVWEMDTGIQDAAERLERSKPLLAKLFPQLGATGGAISSPLLDATSLRDLGYLPKTDARLLIKADHLLPVAGSIKARGGFHEVLQVAEGIVDNSGVFRAPGDVLDLASADTVELFSNREIVVGSTGNLGMSTGLLARKLGFRVSVHMSRDAKEWKKAALRAAGVHVVEHQGDYEVAVQQAQHESESRETSHFIDDLGSTALLWGYSTAAGELALQLNEQGIDVDSDRPLFVYIPCGVGGAPAGITLGLKRIYGDNVHCVFAEPTQAPSFLLGMLRSGSPSVYELGLENSTEADGLAVPVASRLALMTMRNRVSACFTVTDDDLFRGLYDVYQELGQRVEPSAAAGLSGPRMMLESDVGHQLLQSTGLAEATHVVWTTGGSLVPIAEHDEMLRRGENGSP